MSDWWGTPDTATEEGSGLSGFFTGDSGQDFGERLGMLGEIWSRIGSGTGLQGISGQMGAMNERSGKRREKSRRQLMANRLADKLEKSNPQLASMIRSDPEFGLNLVGKQMEAQQESKIRLAEFQAMTPLEIKRAEAKAIAEGDVALSNTLKELRAKQEIADNSPLAKMLRGDDSDTATSAAPDAGVIPRTDTTTPGQTASTATPPPIPNAGTGDMGGGGQPGTGSTASIPATPADPASAFVNDPMKDLQLSPDKKKAARQIELTRKWRVPIQPMQYDMLLQAQYRNDGSFDTIMNNIQTQYDSIVNERRKTAEAERIRLDNRGWDLTGKRNAEAAIYQSELPQVDTPAIGPAPRGGLQQGMQGRVQPESMAILAKAGFNEPLKQFGMEGIDSAAQQIKEQRINTGNSEGAISALRTGVATRDKEQGILAATAKKGHAVQAAAEGMLKLIPRNTDGSITHPADQKRAAMLEAVGAAGDDPYKLVEAVTNMDQADQQALKNEADIDIARKNQRLERQKYDDAQELADQKKDERTKASNRESRVAASSLVRAFDIAHRPGLRAVGTGAGLLSMLGGTNASDMAEVLTQVNGIFAINTINAMRENSPTGASLGNMSDTDVKLAAAKIAAISQAQSPEEFNYAVKDAMNTFYDMVHGEGNGPQRVVLDRENNLTFVDASKAIPQFPGSTEGGRQFEDISTESALAEFKRRQSFGGQR